MNFKESILKETFKLITKYKGVPVYDSNHAIKEFYTHYPDLSIDQYYTTLKRGITVILNKHNKQPNNYVIISKSLGLQILVHLRPDRYDSNKIIGVSPTTLARDEVYHTRNEVKIFVEKNKKAFKEFPLDKDLEFNYFAKDSKVLADFDLVEVL